MEPVQEPFNAKTQLKSLEVAGMKTAVGIALVIILAASSVLWVESASAQSIPKPSVPQFTAEYIPDFVNTTTTDPYTGSNTTDAQNLSSIKLTITNQQCSYSNGSTFDIYYNVRIKGHFETISWNELYPTTQLLPASVNVTQLNPNNLQNYGAPYIWADNIVAANQYLPQSNSGYTTVSISADKLPIKGQIDIQVEAMLGANSSFYRPSNQWAAGVGGSVYSAIAYVTSSGWSSTQTITITEGNTTPQPTAILATSAPTETVTPTQLPTGTPAKAVTQVDVVFGLSWEQVVIAVMAVAIAVLMAALVLSRRKRI
jgi:hypothetical protein